MYVVNRRDVHTVDEAKDIIKAIGLGGMLHHARFRGRERPFPKGTSFPVRRVRRETKSYILNDESVSIQERQDMYVHAQSTIYILHVLRYSQ